MMRCLPLNYAEIIDATSPMPIVWRAAYKGSRLKKPRARSVSILRIFGKHFSSEGEIAPVAIYSGVRPTALQII
jgi:hypothetical protein